MRVLFLASGAFAIPSLAAVAAHHEVLAIVSQPDRPAGRGGRATPTPVARWALDHAPSIPLLREERVNDPGVVASLREIPAEVWIVIAFGQKLGRALLADRFAINLHASLLPRWRGAAPINAAIVAGDRETGNSIITLADRMDAGLILAQSRRGIDPALTAGELHDALAEDGAALVLETLERHAAGRLEPRVQDEAMVTLAPKLGRGDARIDLARPAAECRSRIHGLTPWPGVAVRFRGEGLKLLRVQAEGGEHESACVGTIVDPREGLVACGGHGRERLRLLHVQAAGRRALGWAEFARGQRVRAGELLEPEVGGSAAC